VVANRTSELSVMCVNVLLVVVVVVVVVVVAVAVVVAYHSKLKALCA
jgi:hypothetical protein